MARVRVWAKVCQKCGACVEICPEGLYVWISETRAPKVVRTRDCTSCGHCVAVCPSGAIEHIDFQGQNMPEFEPSENTGQAG